MPGKRAILWDMDGVLVDSGQVHFQAWKKVLSPYDIPYSWDIFAHTFGMTNTAIINELFDNPAPDFVRELDDEKERQFRANVPGNVVQIAGAKEWLQRFQAWGYPQAICSSAPPANIETLLDEVGMRTYFQAVVSAVRMASKPDPAVFLKAAEMVGMPAEHCIVFEDAPAGIEGARRGGMRCVALTTTHPADDLGSADMIVTDLSELSEAQFLRLIETQ
jgi:beta-phosphoglucomutase-like phosphatase (HAD superfamily)